MVTLIVYRYGKRQEHDGYASVPEAVASARRMSDDGDVFPDSIEVDGVKVRDFRAEFHEYGYIRFDDDDDDDDDPGTKKEGAGP